MEKFIKDRQERGYRLLRDLFEVTRGNPRTMFRAGEVEQIGTDLKWSDRELTDAFDWLQTKQLVEQVADDYFRMTEQGHEEVEASVARPGQDTTSFAGDVINHVNTTFNITGPVAALMTGAHSTANVTQALTQNNAVMEHLAALRQAAEELEGDARDEALELVETINEQVAAERPKKGVLRSCGEGLRGLLKPEMVPIVTTLMTIIAESWK